MNRCAAPHHSEARRTVEGSVPKVSSLVVSITPLLIPRPSTHGSHQRWSIGSRPHGCVGSCFHGVSGEEVLVAPMAQNGQVNSNGCSRRCPEIRGAIHETAASVSFAHRPCVPWIFESSRPPSPLDVSRMSRGALSGSDKPLTDRFGAGRCLLGEELQGVVCKQGITQKITHVDDA